MAQNTYAEWFINMMLGWIRWVANGIAAAFQSNSARASVGSTFLRWFGDNWIALLLTLIAVGVLTDWLVWLVRWRPYWLWFRKKRVLLDDDIDTILSDEELMHRFAPPPNRPRRYAPPRNHSHSAYDNDEYDDEYNEEYDDEYDDDPDVDDPSISRHNFDEADSEDDDIDPEMDDEPYDDEYEDDEPAFDRLYGDTYDPDEYDDEWDGEVDDDEGAPDISFDEPDYDDFDDDEPTYRKPSWLKRLKRPVKEEDPFSMNDIYAQMQPKSPARVPRKRNNRFDALYDDADAEIAEPIEPLIETPPPAPNSRRARRQNRERSE